MSRIKKELIEVSCTGLGNNTIMKLTYEFYEDVLDNNGDEITFTPEFTFEKGFPHSPSGKLPLSTINKYVDLFYEFLINYNKDE